MNTKIKTMRAWDAARDKLMEKPDLSGFDVALAWMKFDLWAAEHHKGIDPALYFSDVFAYLRDLKDSPRDQFGNSLEMGRLHTLIGVYQRANENLQNFDILHYAFGEDTFRLLAAIKDHIAGILAEEINQALPELKTIKRIDLSKWQKSADPIEKTFEEFYEERLIEYGGMKGYLEVFQAFKENTGIDYFYKKAKTIFNRVEYIRKGFNEEIDIVLVSVPSLREFDQETKYLTGSKLDATEPRRTEPFEREKELIRHLSDERWKEKVK